MVKPAQLKVPVLCVMVAAALLSDTVLLPVAPSRVPLPMAMVAAVAELMARLRLARRVLPLRSSVPCVIVSVPVSVTLLSSCTVVAPAPLLMVRALSVAVAGGAFSVVPPAPCSVMVEVTRVKLPVAEKLTLPLISRLSEAVAARVAPLRPSRCRPQSGSGPPG